MNKCNFLPGCNDYTCMEASVTISPMTATPNISKPTKYDMKVVLSALSGVGENLYGVIDPNISNVLIYQLDIKPYSFLDPAADSNPNDLTAEDIRAGLENVSDDSFGIEVFPFFTKLVVEGNLYIAYSFLREISGMRLDRQVRTRLDRTRDFIAGKYSAGELAVRRISKVTEPGILETSGLTIGANGRMFSVGDKGGIIYGLAPVPGGLGANQLYAMDKEKGAAPNYVNADFEGLTYDPKTKKLLVVCEKTLKVYTFDPQSKDLQLFLDLRDLRIKFPALANLGAGDLNAQLEGISLERDTSGALTLYLLKERHPLEIYVLKFEANNETAPRSIELIIPKDSRGRTIRNAGDICVKKGRIFLLAGGSREILEIEPRSGVVGQRWSFAQTESRPEYNVINYHWLFGTKEGLIVNIDKPGEISFTIISDQNGLGTTGDPNDKSPRLMEFRGIDR